MNRVLIVSSTPNPVDGRRLYFPLVHVPSHMQVCDSDTCGGELPPLTWLRPVITWTKEPQPHVHDSAVFMEMLPLGTLSSLCGGSPSSRGSSCGERESTVPHEGH